MLATFVKGLATNGPPPIKVERPPDIFVAPLRDPTMAHLTSDQVVEFSMEEVQSSKYRATNSFIRRLFTENRVNTKEIREALCLALASEGEIESDCDKTRPDGVHFADRRVQVLGAQEDGMGGH
ncbi:unnamed protein product [Linum trigynum]|uniref:Uncharacterized protein n=1 Tax=Linum trigynum TaxID=586398 RepID=A0AAV2CFV2_9ROSI